MQDRTSSRFLETRWRLVYKVDHFDLLIHIRDLLKAGVDGLALESQHTKNALLCSPQWFFAYEALQRLNPQRKFTAGQRGLAPSPRARTTRWHVPHG